ncbi:MAG: hypothetical protein SGJ21_10110 [Alphaproteobacteria bacterium]|nr:hypothetical protein [Alphaproteobacteria bacterium]
MALADYVQATRVYRIARGRMKFFRDKAHAFAATLKHDFDSSQISKGFLETWPTGQQIADEIVALRDAEKVLKATWEALTEDEKEAVVRPDDL